MDSTEQITKGKYKINKEGVINNRLLKTLSQHLYWIVSLVFLCTIAQSPEHHKYFWKGTFSRELSCGL